MKLGLGRRLALIAALGLGTSGFLAASAHATAFTQRELSTNQVIAIASPVGNTSHQLLILEQLSSRRTCWQEEGDVVEPLLLNFDFTGICGRGTDSNGYSIRVGGQDLGWQYRLQIVREGDRLKLIGASNTDRNAPPLEIGTSVNQAGEFVRIRLNPGWRLTKRVYNGQPLGHYYLTHDQSLPTLIASAPAPRPTTTPVATAPQPSTPAPTTPPRTTTTPRPTTPSPVTPRPVTPQPGTSSSPSRPVSTRPISTRPVTPQPGSSTSTRPSVPRAYDGPAPSPTDQASNLGFKYRLVVPAPTVSEQNRVRQAVSGAFRTTIEGEVVMQVALQREREDAEEFKEDLERQGFEVRILDIATNTSSDGDRPSPPPSTTPRPTPPSPTRPQVPNSRFVVAIDPGHGGRDPGAVGIGGLQEADIVLDISRKVADILEEQGVRTILTRQDDREIDLDPRIATAERANATIFVSIHANAISLSRPEVNGIETYYYSSSSSRQLAQAIQSNLIRQTGAVDRGVRESRFYVLRYTSMPAVLVETGFITGRDDAARFRDPNARTRLAEAIADGILDYLR